MPEGLTWNVNNFSSDDKSKVKSVSEDGRTLVFAEDVYYNRNGNDTDTVSHIANINRTIYFSESYYDVSKSYDYYVPHEVTCKLEGTVNYKFSESDEMQPITATATISPLTPDIEYGRSYQTGNTKLDGTERKRGRGLAVENYLTVKNNGATAATPGNLYSITDEVVNYNGYAYLSAEQIAALFLEENEFTDIKNVNVKNVVLYEPNASVILEGTHTDTEENEDSVKNTRFNQYTQPEYSNAEMVFEIMAGEPDTIDFSVYSDDSETAERIYNETFEITGTKEELGEKISAALKNAGYIINTGLYSITWDVTDAAREHEIGDVNGNKDSWIWYIETYDSTIKTDYEQGFHYTSGDSWSSFSFDWYYYPTAQATFTEGSGDNAYEIKRTTSDKLSSSSVHMDAYYYNEQTDEFISGMGAIGEMRPGCIIKYSDKYTNGNSLDTEYMPMMHKFDLTQSVLVPVEKNPKLELLGFDKVEFNDKMYYVLKYSDKEQTLNDIWLGFDGEYFCAESIIIEAIDKSNPSNPGGGTVIRWYESKIPSLDNKTYEFYTYVLDPIYQGTTPDSETRFYSNDYYINDAENNNHYSTRLYDYYDNKYKGESISKKIVANPEEKGTEKERISELAGSYIGIGESLEWYNV